jgi:hypothetical protein
LVNSSHSPSGDSFLFAQLERTAEGVAGRRRELQPLRVERPLHDLGVDIAVDKDDAPPVA